MVELGTRLDEQAADETELFDAPDRPLVRVSALLAAVRRRRRVWLCTALAGMLAALVFFLARGPEYSATTTLLLRRATINPQDPARAMETDVQLAQSRNVAGRALSELQLDETVSQFETEYKASSSTDDILQITARAPKPADAAHRAEIVAKAFLDFRGQTTDRETQVQIAALRQQSLALQDQIAPLDDQINRATIEAGSSTAPALANSLGDLLSRRAQVNGQIATVQQHISDVTVDSAGVVQNSRVIDPALVKHRSRLKTLVIDLITGLIGGVALGVGWILVNEVTSNRVRRREDLMLALDAPVSVSVGPLASPRRGLGRGRTMWSHAPAPPAQAKRDIAKVGRHLRDVLATTQSATPALAVVSVDSDEAGGLAVAFMVHGLLGEGNDVLAIDLSASSALAQRFGVAADAVSQVELPGTNAKLWVVSRSLAVGSAIDDWLQLHNLRDETDAVVMFATLDPAEGAGHLAALVTTAVAVVTSGGSTAATLRATSQMLRAAGLRLDSAVLVDADPHDESFGVPAAAAAAVRPSAWA